MPRIIRESDLRDLRFGEVLLVRPLHGADRLRLRKMARRLNLQSQGIAGDGGLLRIWRETPDKVKRGSTPRPPTSS